MTDSNRPALAVTGMRVGEAYIPALDGLRAISILVVLAAHLGLGRIVPGGLGVTIFFFISGALITRQLLAEMQRTGDISLLRFTARRALRLYPGLLAMVVLGGGAFIALGGTITWRQFAGALLYVSNYMLLAGGFDNPGMALHPFTILWSLAVEEHFYLVFPLMTLLLARRPERFVISIALTLIGVALWRAMVAHLGFAQAPLRIEYATDTRIDSILYGALLPALLGSRWKDATLRALANPLPATLLLLLSLGWRAAAFREIWRFSVQGVALLGLVGWLLMMPRARSFRHLLARPAMVWIGRLSYSLYLWHWVVIACAALIWQDRVMALVQSAAMLDGPTILLAGCIAAGAILLASLSYYAIERPMLRLRRRVGSHAPTQITAG